MQLATMSCRDLSEDTDKKKHFSCDFLPVQMVEGLTKVSIDALPNHSWVEVLAEKYTFKGKF